MGTFRMREYSSLGQGYPGGTIPIAQEGGSVVDQTFSFTTSHAESSAFATSTKYIGMIADVGFAYQVAKSPVAINTMVGVDANQLLFIGVPSGYKISVVALA